MVDGQGGVQDEGEGTVRVEMYFVVHYRLSAAPRIRIVYVFASQSNASTCAICRRGGKFKITGRSPAVLPV